MGTRSPHTAWRVATVRWYSKPRRPRRRNSSRASASTPTRMPTGMSAGTSATTPSTIDAQGERPRRAKLLPDRRGSPRRVRRGVPEPRTGPRPNVIRRLREDRRDGHGRQDRLHDPLRTVPAQHAVHVQHQPMGEHGQLRPRARRPGSANDRPSSQAAACVARWSATLARGRGAQGDRRDARAWRARGAPGTPPRRPRRARRRTCSTTSVIRSRSMTGRSASRGSAAAS